MRRLFLLLLPLLPLAGSASVIPTPRTVTAGEGSFVFTSATTIAADAPLRRLADRLAHRLQRPVVQGCTGDGTVVLILDPGAEIPAEGYELTVAPDRIVIRSSDYGGAFYGVQTLLQLLPPEVFAGEGVADGTATACTAIADSPRFAYRGMHLDPTRTWIAPERIKRYIDLFARHKLNKLHLHLADDEGWRIEIKSHPELATVGGFRGGDSPVRAVYGKWGEKYGGYYTQEELRGLIAYAAECNIEIIPEIDLPGHSRAIAQLHPEILCRYTPDTSASNGYDERSAWCVAREENYALLADILGEVCDLFPSPYIHVGGDEVEMSQWQRCPDCQALMQREGMTRPHQLEDRFMARVAEILRVRGKRPAVWNEAVDGGGLSHDSRVYGWTGVKACLDATAKGYETVVMPGAYFYFDMRQSEHEDGHTWASIFDASKPYGFDFGALGFTPEQMRLVAGVQGAFWSELYVSHEPETPDYLDYMLFPRVCSLAELAWHGNAEGWDAFRRTLIDDHYDRMAAMEIRFRLFPPKLTCGQGTMSVATDDRSEIWYVEEGGEPQRYTKPLHTDEPQRYRFFTRYKTGRSPYVADRSYYRTIAPALKLSTSMGESSHTPYANVETYKTFARTTRACRQGDWILYTFDEPVACREILLQTGHRHLPKTIVTTGDVCVSYDGEEFVKCGELEKGAFTLHPNRPVRALRIVSTCDDNGCSFVTIQPPQIKR